MQYRKLCIVISFLSLQLVASNRYDHNILPTVAPELTEEHVLRKEIAWKNKIAYAAPLAATAIGAIASFMPLMEYEYDESKRNAKGTFLCASPIIAAGATYSMPKSVCVNPDDTIYDLRKKSKQCDDNIQRGAALGLVRGACLPGTLGMAAVALLYGGDAVSSNS